MTGYASRCVNYRRHRRCVLRATCWKRLLTLAVPAPIVMLAAFVVVVVAIVDDAAVLAVVVHARALVVAYVAAML